MEVVNAATGADIDKAFDTLVERKVDALLLGGDAFYGGRIQELCRFLRVIGCQPCTPDANLPRLGGLPSYGASVAEAYRKSACMLPKSLRAQSRANCRSIQATKFELVLNLKTAKALGLDRADPAFSAVADEVIE